jgi:15-cis-phytoene synthase
MERLMRLQTHAWESALLLRAHEAGRNDHCYLHSRFSAELLERAYLYCEAATAFHSKSFYLASKLLPLEKRRAVQALYAFCRETDDLVDCGSGERQNQLDLWRDKVMSPTPPEDDFVAVAWTDARMRYGIPNRYAEQLIEGVAQDLVPRRFQTFDELASYSYGVASTVGLMSMHIIGYSSPDAVRYAIKLGVALQITNIIRDVAEDLQAGRVYLPCEDLQAFKINDGDLTAGKVNSRWRDFMRFQIERNRRLYAEAMPGIALLNPDGRFAIAAAADLYQRILVEIERRDYNVFSRRASVSTLGKLLRLPSIWWISRRVTMTANTPLNDVSH